MTTKKAEIDLEQAYFDRCAGERERRRRSLSEGHRAGAGPIAGQAALKKALGKLRDKWGSQTTLSRSVA